MLMGWVSYMQRQRCLREIQEKFALLSRKHLYIQFCYVYYLCYAMLLDRAGQEECTGLILQCEQGREHSTCILYLLCRLRPIYVALYGTGRARFSSYHIYRVDYRVGGTQGSTLHNSELILYNTYLLCLRYALQVNNIQYII